MLKNILRKFYKDNHLRPQVSSFMKYMGPGLLVTVGWVMPRIPQGSIPIVMSVLGAVVMPHNLFLHSEICLLYTSPSPRD